MWNCFPNFGNIPYNLEFVLDLQEHKHFGNRPMKLIINFAYISWKQQENSLMKYFTFWNIRSKFKYNTCTSLLITVFNLLGNILDNSTTKNFKISRCWEMLNLSHLFWLGFFFMFESRCGLNNTLFFICRYFSTWSFMNFLCITPSLYICKHNNVRIWTGE